MHRILAHEARDPHPPGDTHRHVNDAHLPAPRMEMRPRLAASVLIAGTALLFLSWQVTHLNGPGTGYDEGVYLASARSLASGSAPYKTLFFSKPPLFAVLLDAIGHASGWHLAGYRLAMVLCALVTLLVSAALAWRWRGPGAAAATAALLAISPKFVFYARPLGSDTPVFVLMMVGLLAGAIAIERQARWAWAVTGGAVIAAAGMKPNGGLLLPMIIVGGVWWLSKQPRAAWRPALLRALFSVAGAIPVLLVILPFSLQPHAYEQSITYELAGRSVYPLDPAGNLRHIVSFIWLDRGVVVLAAVGLVLALRRPLSLVPVLLLSWLTIGGVFLVLHTPLFSHHISVLLPPLAIFAGSGLATLAGRVGASLLALRAGQPLAARVWVATALTGLVLLGVIALVPHVVALNRASARQVRSASERQFDAALRQFIPPGARVITDDQFAAFRARLPVAAWFADTSTYRIDSGYLTSAEAIAKTEAEQPGAIVVAADKLPRLKEYIGWVTRGYDPVWSDGARTIYRAKPQAINGKAGE